MKRKDNTPLALRVMQWLFPRLERWAPFMAKIFFRMVFYVPMSYRVPDKEKEAARRGKKISLISNGKKLKGYQWGEDTWPYVLFIHGWAGRATQFRKFIGPLNQAEFRMVGYDGPAHGRSEGIQTSILEFEKMLQNIFSKMGEPVAVITHSFGGAAALYSAMNGLPIHKLINIASPAIADEILKTYLRAIRGSWSSAERFKEYVKRRTGKTFEEFTSLHAVRHLSHPVDLLMIHDEHDPDVYMMHAEALLKEYPSAKLIRTTGLGHTRILKDEKVIQQCLDFIGSLQKVMASKK